MSTVNPPVTRRLGNSERPGQGTCVNSVILGGNGGVRHRGPGDIEPPIQVASVYGMIVRDCLYVRARGLREREGEGYVPGAHRVIDSASSPKCE